jgi:hypothetical protein
MVDKLTAITPGSSIGEQNYSSAERFRTAKCPPLSIPDRAKIFDAVLLVRCLNSNRRKDRTAIWIYVEFPAAPHPRRIFLVEQFQLVHL